MIPSNLSHCVYAGQALQRLHPDLDSEEIVAELFVSTQLCLARSDNGRSMFILRQFCLRSEALHLSIFSADRQVNISASPRSVLTVICAREGIMAMKSDRNVLSLQGVEQVLNPSLAASGCHRWLLVPSATFHYILQSEGNH